MPDPGLPKPTFIACCYGFFEAWLQRPWRAVTREVNRFFLASWPGLLLGFLAATTVYLVLYHGLEVDTGLGWGLDVMLVVTFAILGTGLAALVLWLLRKSLMAWPWKFSSTFMATTISFSILTSFLGVPGPFPLILVGVFLVLGGGLGGAWAALRRLKALGGGWIHRSIAVLLLVLTLSGLGLLVSWLADSGTDPYLEMTLAASTVQGSLPGMPDPSAPGPHRVRTLTYGSGTDRHRPEFGAQVAFRTEPVDASLLLKGHTGWKAKVRKAYWGFDKDRFPLNGRVWYPEGPGPFPLVLTVHGNHRASLFSDPGYAYLGELFASRGMIFVSVDENFLNESWEGGILRENATRGWILLKHLEAWRTWQGAVGNPFHDKVDLERIGLIGHSRGGEAVAHAAILNRLKMWPEDSRLTFNFGFNIRAVAAIAPTDGQYETANQPIILEDVDYFTMQGSHDSDVSYFAGHRTFRRARFKDGTYHFKASLYVHRANHGQFNTTWGRYDALPPVKRFLATKALLAGEDQRRIAKVFLSAFLESSLRGQKGYLPLFQDPRDGAPWLPRTIYLSQFEDSTHRALAHFEGGMDLTKGSVPGTTIEGRDLSTWRQFHIIARGDFSYQQTGVWLGWEPKGEPSYALHLPPNLAKSWKLNGHTRLVISLADTNLDPHLPTPGVPKENKSTENKPKEMPSKIPKAKDPVDLTLELVDQAGRMARLPLSRYSALQPVLKIRFTKWPLLEKLVYNRAWQPTFQTFELPLSLFQATDPGWSPEGLKTLRMRFDRTPKGVIILDRVGFRFPEPERRTRLD